MTNYRFVGVVPTILEICGFQIRATKPSWLSDEYDCLVSIQHHTEDPGSVVLMPINLDDEEAFKFLWGHLLSTQQTKLLVLGRVLPWLGGYHDEGVHSEPFKDAFDSKQSRIEKIRMAKEKAIMDQRFDDAADLRDQERKLINDR